MANYQEYPKAMKHPQHRAAVLSKDEWVNGRVVKAAPGQPEKFPPVYVNNIDQETQYASLGYLPNGTSDPDAYLSAVVGANEPSGHEHHEFPKWLYAADEEGELAVETPEGVTVQVQAREVKDQQAQDRLLGEWYATPGDAAAASLADEAPAETAQDGEADAPARSRNRRR